MARIDGGAMLIRVLAQHGIREIFTLHGGHLDAIFQAALDHGMRLIDTRHEQAAGHAADGWARTTGRPGVAIVTAGPGVTDVVSSVANAYLDCIPILFIGGAPPLADAEMLPLQGGIDQLALMQPITKWAHRITHVQRVPDLVAQALRVATTARPGPVFLEIPADVLFKRVDEKDLFFPQRLGPEARPAPAAQAVEQAIDWLQSAQRPAILAGGGCWFSGAASELLAFAEHTGIPVVNNDRQWGMSLHGQELMYGTERIVGTALAPTRYDLAAAGFGCHGDHVEHPDALVPALQRALACERPACVNVMTDPAVIHPLTRMMVTGAVPTPEADDKIRMPYYGERDA